MVTDVKGHLKLSAFKLQDSFQSLVDIFSWYGDNQDDMIPVAGSGNWNDPDMVSGLSLKCMRTQCVSLYHQSSLQTSLFDPRDISRFISLFCKFSYKKIAKETRL